LPEWGYCRLWYHGSQVRLERLPVGSTITQNRNLARAFAHKPTFVSLTEAKEVRHDGVEPGYIYCVSEEVRPRDVKGHTVLGIAEPKAWLTQRSLRIKLIGRIEPDPVEKLTEEQVFQMRKEQSRPSDHRTLAN
jgi:hypothetical protein